MVLQVQQAEQHGKDNIPESTRQHLITTAFVKLNPHGLAVQGNIVVFLQRFLCAFRFFKLDKCCAICFATADQSMMWMWLFGSMKQLSRGAITTMHMVT